MQINLTEKSVRTIWAVLGNCINYLRYNEDGSLSTLSEGYQNLVRANEEFTMAIIKAQKEVEEQDED